MFDKTEKKVMQSYIKYRKLYDKKAKASAFQEKVYWYIIQPTADQQGSTKRFRDFRWIGPYVVQKALSNEIYIVCKVNTNKSQILHRIRFCKFAIDMPLKDKNNTEKFGLDDAIVISQDDLYSIV